MNHEIKELPMEAEERYLHALVSKLFKLLPIQEEGNRDAFVAYAQGLQRELSDCASVLRRIACDRDWANILAILTNIADDNVAFAQLRSDVFRMISLCETLISRHFYGGLDDE